jgi:hypothetical protein
LKWDMVVVFNGGDSELKTHELFALNLGENIMWLRKRVFDFVQCQNMKTLCAVLHIAEYPELAKSSEYHSWQQSNIEEIARLAQGYKNIKGTCVLRSLLTTSK